jgi:purine/pyrimidine-nucleoside phosphorylase
MINVNEYFGGKVKSLGFISESGKATAGVMEAGEYEFGTSTVEIMAVISGKLSVKLPGKGEYKTFGPGKKFTVGKDMKFQVKALIDTSYICYYK